MTLRMLNHDTIWEITRGQGKSTFECSQARVLVVADSIQEAEDKGLSIIVDMIRGTPSLINVDWSCKLRHANGFANYGIEKAELKARLEC